MIKKALYTAALLAVALLNAGCQHDEALDPMPAPDDGFVQLEFSADIPAPTTCNVGTRAVDPDGGGVSSMTLFCFDNFGLFISTATADIVKTDTYTGTFSVKKIPLHTRRIHFVANQNMTDFTESAFINKSESEVMALLEGSAGHMIYWARFAYTVDPTAANPKNIAEKLAESGGKIVMLRNHALVSVDHPTDNGKFVVTGMAAYNIQAFGTVAPYDPVRGFDFTPEQWKADTYVTIPTRDAKQSDIMNVTANTAQYIFEHENRSDDPVSIILRGHAPGQTGSEDLYYRVMLYDNANGEFFPIRRNHKYTLQIQGALSYGQPTFEKALTAPATNNVWVSISDDVNEVENKDYVLSVDQTSLVVDDAQLGTEYSRYIVYTLKAKNGKKISQADKPSVTWIDNTVASQDIRNDEFRITEKGVEVAEGGSGDVGVGNVAITLRALGSNDRLEGTLLVKYKQLQRKVKVILIRKQKFVPSWISTGLYSSTPDEAADKKQRSHVTLMFTVPEDCPQELLPMNVYVTAPGLDVRSLSGMVLPVVRKGDTDWYSSNDGPADVDYKFVHTVNAPGLQRIYFESILSQQIPEEGGTILGGTVYVEAPHFTTISRTYTFTDTERRAIGIENVGEYKAPDLTIGANDELVHYYRVPQKIGAPVELKMLLYKQEKAGTNWTTIPINADGVNLNGAKTVDEFLFYTQNLNNYERSEYLPYPSFQPDCLFSPYTEKAASWMQYQNPNGGRMLMFRPREGFVPDADNTGKYTLHLYTNRAQSTEVIRLSSNIRTQPSVIHFDPALKTDTGYDGDMYTGGEYRSFVIELANYTPFRFGARLRYNNGDWDGDAENVDTERVKNPSLDIPEEVTPLTWSFEPERKVDIAIDITSFAGLADTKKEDDAEDPRVTVDPFGRAFEIYIDAPMLRIDEGRLAECKLNSTKLQADPSVPGRFIYTVEADRDAERVFGMADALNVYTDPTTVNPSTDNQTGERKILPFVVNSVASAGDIVISSNKSQVVFYDKIFRVTNESIKGKIVYEVEDPETGAISQVDVPDDLFVAFERVTNSNRIGSVTMTGDGQFELRLRKEYPLNWLSYPVAFHFEHGEHVHHARYESLAEMYDAIMVRGETVVLKRELERH